MKKTITSQGARLGFALHSQWPCVGWYFSFPFASPSRPAAILVKRNLDLVELPVWVMFL